MPETETVGPEEGREGVRDTLRSLLTLFSRREKRSLIWIVLLALAVALLQAFSVASIMPFLGLVANPGLVEEAAWLGRIYDGLGFTTVSSFLMFAGAAVLAILAITNVLSALATWATFRFVWNQHHRLSVELLRRYLYRPYTYFLNQNRSELSKKLLQEVQLVTDGGTMQLIMLIADAGVVIAIFALLIWVDWKLSLIVMITLSGAYLMTFALVRRNQARLGVKRSATNTERFRFSGEALEGIKNVIVSGRQEAFVHRFREPSKVYSDTIRNSYLVGMLPRFAMETLAFGGIVVIMLYLLQSGAGADELIASAGLYAFAAYKVLPALQHAFHSVTRLQFFQPAVGALVADFQVASGLPAEVGPEPPSVVSESWHTLGMRDVWFTYPGTGEATIRGVELAIRRNSWVAFVGATGSGKTTVVDLLFGLLPCDRGAVTLDGLPLDEGAVAEWRGRCGYVPQEAFLTDDSIGGNIAFGVPPEAWDGKAIRSAARTAGLEDFVQSLDQGFDAGSGERGIRLSGGQRQRIGIARALYDSPDVLVFDEATSALDGVTEEGVLRNIKDLSAGVTMVMIAHRISTVKECDQIFLMDDGQIVAQGTYEELVASEARFRALEKRSADAGTA